MIEQKDKYLHRDLSWLLFNQRVLEQALDENNPLLERAKFLAIAMNNLDEFIMVRYAGQKRLVDSDYNLADVFGCFPREICAETRRRIDDFVGLAYRVYEQKIAKQLKAAKIHLKKYAELTTEQKKQTRKYFDSTIFPIATPMAVDQGHPLPLLHSRNIAFFVLLERDGKAYHALVPVPAIIPRVLKLMSRNDNCSLILVDEIVRENLGHFFRGYRIMTSAAFRILRDSEYAVNEEFSPDLLQAIEAEIKQRPRGKVVFLELEATADPRIAPILSDWYALEGNDPVKIFGPLDLRCLFEVCSAAADPALQFKAHTPRLPEYTDIFTKIQAGDLLINLPFQTFEPTIDLLRTAAQDQNVLAIKITLYRTDKDSAVIAALKDAARNKKQVTVLVEIKARFDEEQNILWARELEEVGCHVIYGFPGMKIHSKIALIVRQEESRIVRYVHLSTGNYNEKTAQVYTDIGYFTCNPDFGREVSDIFNVITGCSLPARWKRIISSPHDLRKYFFELIDQEMEFQEKYQNGRVFAKLNSLEDVEMIDKLYEASGKNVKIRLIVRGICSLVPGVKGLSDNIEVRSVVGRFLEHSRVFSFNNNDYPRYFLSSADWMRRNFDRRIELLFEIYKPEIKEELRLLLETYWQDDAKASVMQNNRNYVKRKKEDGFNAQEALLIQYAK